MDLINLPSDGLVSQHSRRSSYRSERCPKIEMASMIIRHEEDTFSKKKPAPSRLLPPCELLTHLAMSSESRDTSSLIQLYHHFTTNAPFKAIMKIIDLEKLLLALKHLKLLELRRLEIVFRDGALPDNYYLILTGSVLVLVKQLLSLGDAQLLKT